MGGIHSGCFVGCGVIFSLDVGLGPFVTFVLPYGRVGSGVQNLGTGLAGVTAVTFNGVPTTTFNAASDTEQTLAADEVIDMHCVPANLYPEPVAKRRGRALGRELPTRTARTCHSSERATLEATPFRLHLLLS